MVGDRPRELFSRLDYALSDKLNFMAQAFRRQLKEVSVLGREPVDDLVEEAWFSVPHQLAQV